MSNIANISLLAIDAYNKSLSAIANNVANINTDGFKKSRAVMEAKDTSGVSASVEQVNTPGDMVTIDGVQHETSNVSLEEELTSLITTNSNFEANLKAMRTSNKLQGMLIDIMA